MSKKVIAIALFAVMVLSLIPFANAATKTFAVLETVYATQTNTATPQNPWGGIASFDVKSNPNGTINLGGDYDTLFANHKTIGDTWAANEVLRQDFALEFAGDDADTITVISSVSGSKTVTLKELASGKFVYTHSFIAKKGGNSETITVLSVKGSGGSQTTSQSTFTIKFVDGGDAAKTVQNLFVKLKNSNPDGKYNAYNVGGILFIDYANNLSATTTLEVGLEFYSDAAGSNRVPAKDRVAKVIWNKDHTSIKDDGTGFFVKPANAGTSSEVLIKNNEAYKATINTPVTATATPNKTEKFKIRIEDENYLYDSGDIVVVWTAVPANAITNVNISPSRNVTIAIGETVEFTITPTHSTTWTNVTLEDTAPTSVRSVYVDGKKVKGVAEGTTVLTVKADGRPIDAITVTVVKEKTPDPVDNNQYRVIARKLNVRAGAGTNTAVVGSLSQNQIVEVVSIENGWAKLSNGNYVSAQYIVKIEAANGVGNHQVTASSLNVRASANGSKIGSVKKGTTVNVISIENGWAQISYGSGIGYVSTAYLKAL